MTERPKIPADMEREVLTQAGHRCAVCGEPFPLERAHIIPWRESRQHKLDDLICLCANCHQRADTEKWGESTLRKYKKRPWVVRRQDNPPQEIQLVELTCKLDLASFNGRADVLQYAIAAFLGISPAEVEIMRIEEGSVRVTIGLPANLSSILRDAYERRDPELRELLASFNVTAVKTLPDVMKINQDRWGLELRPAAPTPLGHDRAVAGDSYTTAGSLALDLDTKERGAREIINSRLALLSRESPVDRIMVENLLQESHLPTSVMRHLLIALIESEEPSEMRAAIRRICRANTLKGRQIQLPKDTIFISVQSLDSFCLWLVKSSVFASVIHARSWVAAWVARMPLRNPGNLLRLAGHLPMSPFTTWAYPVLESEDSIQDLSAQEIRGRLGIYDFPPGDSLILFKYVLPKDETPRFPTLCDAYASEFWPTNFRSALTGATYGFTVPINDKYRPVPKVVHRPVLIRNVLSVRVVQ